MSDSVGKATSFFNADTCVKNVALAPRDAPKHDWTSPELNLGTNGLSVPTSARITEPGEADLFTLFGEL